MQKPEIVLNILNNRSLNNSSINDIYRCLFNPEWYLIAYNKLANNKGSLISGETNETIDGMSLKRIDEIIDEMKFERYKWHKYKQINISKLNGSFRTLSIPEWRDKLVQEVLRMILSAIYEPKFSDASHGFRPGRGCHTALERIYQKSKACEYFIEGDIEKCFDSMNHDVLLNILKRDIKDGRFIELIRKMLKAGKFGNDFVYGKTYSGIPQGGVLSPLLANIYLNELDQFIESTLLSKWNIDKERPKNKKYHNISKKIEYAEKKLKRKHYRTPKEKVIEELKLLRKELRTIPSAEDLDKCTYRRLIYTRYADDWILSFTGTYKEAKKIKEEIKQFLLNELKLNLSDEKTKITLSRNEKNPARFLNYNIITQWNNNKIYNGRRSLCGEIAFMIPYDVICKKKNQYIKNNKIVHMPQYLHESVFDIIRIYQNKYRGIHQYYKFARNQELFSGLKYVMETSLVKTIANKLKITVTKVYKKYSNTKLVDGYNYKVLSEVIYSKDNTKMYQAYFGALPLKKKPFTDNKINDSIIDIINNRSTLAQRLLNNKCELCGSEENIQMHHINKLKNIKKSKANWAKKMIAMNRKTIALCENCHNLIHNGKYDKDRKLR